MATVVRAEDVRLVETPGRNQTGGVATPSRGAGEVSVIRQRQMPGGTNPWHSHDREEVTLLAAGRVLMTVSDEKLDLASGDTVIVPAGVLHKVETIGDEPAEWLLVAPAGVRFFREDGDDADPAWAR